LLTCD